jgi:beta-glucanase (GH16 family)
MTARRFVTAAVIGAVLLVGFTTVAMLPTQTCTPGKNLWTDDFDGPAGSPPDSTKWVAAVGGGGWGNNELQVYSPANAALDGDSHLVISAVIDDTLPRDQRYTSARLTSLESFTTGRLSARILLPDGVGLLPAFWAMGADLDTVGWPAAGEIDIVETPFGTERTVHSIHGPSQSGERSAGDSTDVQHAEPLSAGFHTYWIERTAGRITIGIDDDKVATFDRAHANPDLVWVFDKPFTALFSLAIGGNWPGAPDSSTPARSDMTIDWVRLDQVCSRAS